jgi:hypothetical protein
MFHMVHLLNGFLSLAEFQADKCLLQTLANYPMQQPVIGRERIAPTGIAHAASRSRANRLQAIAQTTRRHAEKSQSRLVEMISDFRSTFRHGIRNRRFHPRHQLLGRDPRLKHKTLSNSSAQTAYVKSAADSSMTLICSHTILKRGAHTWARSMRSS